MTENYLTAFWRSLTKGTAVVPSAEETDLALTNLSRKYTDLEGRYEQLVADHEEAKEKLVVFHNELVKMVDNFKYREAELKETISDLHSVLNKQEWDQLEDKTKKIALQVHEELHHG